MGPYSNLNILKLFLPLCQQTSLHIAVREGQKHTVKRLVKTGADTNIQDNGGVGVAIILVLN